MRTPVRTHETLRSDEAISAYGTARSTVEGTALSPDELRKIERELGWRPKRNFEQGLRETVSWYLSNEPWWAAIRSGAYRGERLGVAV